MIDEKKTKQVQDLRKEAEDAATAEDMARIWKPLKLAAQAQGATELRDYHGKGFEHPPFGWKSPDPSALGSVLEVALLEQLSGLLAKHGSKPPSKDEKGWKLRSKQGWEDRRAMALAGWGLGFVSDCGGYAQSLQAFNRACRELPLLANPAPLREIMLRSALNPGWRSTPDEVSARLIALAGSQEVWGSACAWGAQFAEDSDHFMDMHSGRLDIGHWGAALIKAGSDRHACAGAVVFLLSKFAKTLSSSEIDWSSVGTRVGGQLGYNFLRAEKIPEAFFEGLPMVFWLGAKSEMGPSSKVGALIYQRLLARAALDPKVKSKLCASAWMGFDRKEIDAFDEKFPEGSAALLKPAVAEEFSRSSSCVPAVYRIAKTLARPSGSWARKAFAAHGLEPSTIVDKGWHGTGGTQVLVEAMGSAYAVREAMLIKEQVRAAALQKAADDGKKKAPALKKAKPKRI